MRLLLLPLSLERRSSRQEWAPSSEIGMKDFLATQSLAIQAASQYRVEMSPAGDTAGGGLAAIHGAVFGPRACEEKWAWYGGVFCCAFTNHSSILPATVKVEDRENPSTLDLPAQWQRTDEWYNFTGTPRGCARVLATLDESTYHGGTMGADHPIAWCRRVGQGRMWYTAMGHTRTSYAEPLFQKHLLGGILIAAGKAPANFQPNKP